MGIAYGVSTQGLGDAHDGAAPVFAFGLVAFGFLGMGPVTIAVDSLRPGDRQRPVGLRAVAHRDAPRHQGGDQEGLRLRRRTSSTAKHYLEENDGAGNTFKATAKPVLIGTAVVGATTMIFSIIMALTQGLTHGPRQAVAAPPAVPARPDHRRRGHLLVHRRLDAGGDHRRLPRGRVHQGATSSSTAPTKASIEDSKKVVEICTQYAQKGMFNIFLDGLLHHPGLRLPRAVLLHRLPDLDRALRPLPGHLHGQRRRRLGQRQEDRRGRAEGEGHRAARRHRRRRHRRRSRSRTPRRWP